MSCSGFIASLVTVTNSYPIRKYKMSLFTPVPKGTFYFLPPRPQGESVSIRRDENRRLHMTLESLTNRRLANDPDAVTAVPMVSFDVRNANPLERLLKLVVFAQRFNTPFVYMPQIEAPSQSLQVGRNIRALHRSLNALA